MLSFNGNVVALNHRYLIHGLETSHVIHYDSYNIYIRSAFRVRGRTVTQAFVPVTSYKS